MSFANVARSNLLCRRSRWVPVGLWLIGLLLLTSSPGQAKLVRDKDAASDAPRVVFGLIAQAWENGDQQILADLIHADGLRVTTGRSTDRVSNYSPSQAYYYFRNLFQSYRTLLFEFEMMQDASAGAQVHGMATWKRRRPDSAKIQDVKLVCILMLEDDQWKLAEINTIR